MVESIVLSIAAAVWVGWPLLTKPAVKTSAKPVVKAKKPENKGNFCPQCGAKVNPNDRFCSQCGAKTNLKG